MKTTFRTIPLFCRLNPEKPDGDQRTYTYTRAIKYKQRTPNFRGIALPDVPLGLHMPQNSLGVRLKTLEPETPTSASVVEIHSAVCEIKLPLVRYGSNSRDSPGRETSTMSGVLFTNFRNFKDRWLPPYRPRTSTFFKPLPFYDFGNRVSRVVTKRIWYADLFNRK